MYQEIKEHILEGKLPLAFEEIAALDLSRDQRDELLKVEARYNRLQRESGQMTAEMRGIESERLNDRVLKLINRVADGAEKLPPEVPAGPRVNDPRAALEKQVVKSSIPNVPVLIGVGLVLILAVLWASGTIGGNSGDVPGGKTGEISKVEPAVEQEPGTATPTNPSVDPAFKSPSTFQKTEVSTADLKPANLNVSSLKIKSKPTIGLYYKRNAIINRDKVVAKRKARVLDSLLTEFDVHVLEADPDFLTSSSFKKIKTGDLGKGRIEGLKDDYILYVESKTTGRLPNLQISSTYRMYRASDGASVLQQDRSATADDPEKGERQIVSKIISNVERLNRSN
ncbi:hypothetical protein CEQ90_16815 [Lewinellaceae bacterium SD302]|nr:hypothetical protein CEQ90_16815 [Lewinellaceae bacterium SD302]